MDSETSTPIGGSAKKRRLGPEQNPLAELKLDAKNYEIQKLNELVQTLHEKVSALQEEKWNASNTLDKENSNIKANQETEGDKKKFEEEMAKMKSLVKDKEEEIEKLKAEISSKSKNEEKLQTKIVNLEKSLGTFKTQNSKMEKEIKSLKSKTLKSSNEPGLQYVALEENINGVRVNTDLLSPEHIPETDGNQIIDLTEENSLVEEHGHVEDVVAEAEVQVDQPSNGSCDDTIQQLQEENSELHDPTQTCNLADVIVNFEEIDYERLNGKVLLHSDLRYVEGKWSVRRMTIPFSDYKKLTGNKISFLRLNEVIVNDENGIKVGIDKLWKEVKNVTELRHTFNDGEAMSEIAQKLVELTPFPNLVILGLKNVQDGFNLQAFYQFLVKNTKVRCTLHCSRKSLKQMKEARKKIPKFPAGRFFRIE
uniref:Uncharacterized protein n=1 Tax=Panagrolaimus davidi TaxID=227884 RepID=A0A914PS25_9BILA